MCFISFSLAFSLRFKMCIRDSDIAEHDGSAYLDDLPESMYYHVLPQTVEWRVDVNQVYGYPYPCLLYTSRCV